jgi:hypothetical protein
MGNDRSMIRKAGIRDERDVNCRQPVSRHWLTAENICLAGRLAGEGFAKNAAAEAITFPLTAPAQVPKSRPSADLSEQLAGA